MPRPIGVPNKLTADVKDRLQLVMDNIISSLNNKYTNIRPKDIDVTDRFTVFDTNTKAHFG